MGKSTEVVKVSSKMLRAQLKEDLVWLGIKVPGATEKFKLIYSNSNLNAPLDAIVDNLTLDQLKWATIQVTHALGKDKK